MSKKIVVGASVTNLISEVPNFRKQSIGTSLINRTDVVQDLMNNIKGSLKFKFNSLYMYGRDSYTLGLPKGVHEEFEANTDEVEAIIETQEGEGVEIRSNEVALNPWYEIAASVLHQDGYRLETTNQGIELLDPLEGYPDDFVWFLSDGRLLDSGDFEIILSHSRDFVGGGQPYVTLHTLTYTGLDLENNEWYYVTSYKFDTDSTGLYKGYWHYRVASNTYPQLSLNTNNIESGNPYYPVAFIRHRNENMTSVDKHNTDLYKTTKIMLNKVGLDLQDLGNAVHGDPDMEYPGDPIIAQIDGVLYQVEVEEPYDVIPVGGVPSDDTPVELPEDGVTPDVVLDSSSPAYSQDYIAWEHSARVRSRDIDAYNQNQEKMNNIGDIDHAYVVFAVQLAEDEPVVAKYLWEYFKRLMDKPNQKTKKDYTTWLDKGGYSAPENWVSISYPENNYRQVLIYHYIESKILKGSIGKVNTVHKTIVEGKEKSKHGSNYDTSEIVLTKQITSDTYERLVIKGLKHRNDIYSHLHYVETNVRDLKDEDLKGNFLIPLHRFSVDNLATLDEIELYYYSMHLLVNSQDTVKLKWYQTKNFKILVTFIAVVVAIFTGINIATVFLQAGLLAAAEALAYQLIANLVVTAVFKEVIETFGVDAALILAAILTIISVSSKMSEGVSNSLADLPFAEDLLNSLGAIQDAITESLDDDLKELTQQLEEAEEELEELEEAYEELLPDISLDTYLFRSPVMLPITSEPVNAYYDRVIHTGNIGTKSLDAIEYYVNSKIKLPTADETITT